MGVEEVCGGEVSVAEEGVGEGDLAKGEEEEEEEGVFRCGGGGGVGWRGGVVVEDGLGGDEGGG